MNTFCILNVLVSVECPIHDTNVIHGQITGVVNCIIFLLPYHSHI
jgi:hypothetical protein